MAAATTTTSAMEIASSDGDTTVVATSVATYVVVGGIGVLCAICVVGGGGAIRDICENGATGAGGSNEDVAPATLLIVSPPEPWRSTAVRLYSCMREWWQHYQSRRPRGL